MDIVPPVLIDDPTPFPTVAFIETWFPNPVLQNGQPNLAGFEVGTGTLIAPRLVLTAAHVVHDAAQGGLTTRVRVTINGDRGRPQDMRPAAVDFPQEWGRGQDTSVTSPFDFAIIQLAQPVGITPMPVAKPVADDTELLGTLLNVLGYPANPPGGRLGDLFGTRFELIPGLFQFARRLFYPVATLGGMSGGPVYSLDSSGTRVLRGVHTSLVQWADGSETGSALRIDAAVEEFIEAWIRDFGQ